jgi:hypothetical protein
MGHKDDADTELLRELDKIAAALSTKSLSDDHVRGQVADRLHGMLRTIETPHSQDQDIANRLKSATPEEVFALLDMELRRNPRTER